MKEMNRKKYKMIGMILICLGIGLFATKSLNWQTIAFGRIIIGAPMVALLLSMMLCNLLPALDSDKKLGTTFASKKFLNWAIILTGATLSFRDILGTGLKALPLIIFNIFLAFTISIFIGKKIGINLNTSILVGGGTSICGGTAIGTLSRIIKAHEEEIAFAMTAIFLFDTLAAFSYPYLADLLHLSSNQFAFWAGTSINDTSSVAGAQATYIAIHNLTAYNGAINVKLIRTTMLIFVALTWTVIGIGKQKDELSDSLITVVKKTFPLFILGFLIAIGLNTIGLFSIQLPFLNRPLSDFIGVIAKFLFASALAGVGFKIKLSEVFSKGSKPILLGGITWLSVCLSSLLFIFVFSVYQ